MTNARRFSAALREMARVPSRVSTAIAKDISREIQKNFSAGVDPYGRAWRQLAKSTIKAGRHPPPLTDTGEGRRSVVVKAAQGAGINIVVGVLYMLYHQFGGASHLRGPGGSYRKRRKNKNFGRDKDRSAGRGNPPKRSFLPFERMPPKWEAIWEKHLKAMLRKGGFRG